MDTSFAAIRFGYGFGKTRPQRHELLAGLARKDSFANSPLTDIPEMMGMIRGFRAAQKASKDGGKRTDEHRQFIKDIGARDADLHKTMVLRAVSDHAPLRERLNWFWIDHFTVEPKGQMLRLMIPSFVDNAIRPNITGRFADLLWAAISHPAMLFYLDNQVSRGPNSVAGKGRRGLNENLARELLELHSLGADGGYTQGDVTELAKLLTGLRVGGKGTRFFPKFAEPGAETVLGVNYFDGADTILAIRNFIEDIAIHPQTAHHLAHKLAVHFVDDAPNPDLVTHMKQAYLAGDGELMPMYQAMLDHPASWAKFGTKVKQPFDFFVSGLRALGVDAKTVKGASAQEVKNQIVQPLKSMGQPMFRAGGPDGWPEHGAAWITANGLAGRIAWAGDAAATFGTGLDPRSVLAASLGDYAGPRLKWAVPKAANKTEGLALILAAPEFNRR